MRSVVPSEDGKYLLTASNDQVEREREREKYLKRCDLTFFDRLPDFGIFKQESQRWNLEGMNMY